MKTASAFVLIRFVTLSLLIQVNSVMSPLPTEMPGALTEIPYACPALLS